MKKNNTLISQHQPDVSVIIVTYREVQELKACLRSLFQSNSSKLHVPIEVIVVDNDRNPKLKSALKKSFPQVRYVESPGNIGFGPANNLGASQARGKYLFFLNPDTEVQTGAIKALTSFLDTHSQAAVAAPSLYTMDGQLYPDQGSAQLTPLTAIAAHSIVHRLWPSNPIASQYWLRHRDVTKPQRVAVVPGTALMIQRNIFEQVQGFDEQFFIYFEESDLCRRVASVRGESWIIPEAKIKHIWHAATKSSKYNQIFRDSRYKYFKKYYGVPTASLLELLLHLGKHELALIVVGLIATTLYILTS